ncbi:MAG: hypothetical protein QG608_2838 [Actinomycetota bacterium]|nr:hypothetical protein [Actinomycetota bacterium]
MSPTPPTPPTAPTATPATTADRRRTVGEIWLVLGLSLGQSAVYSVISLMGKLTAGRTLASQSATLNSPASPRPYLDLSYQLSGILFAVVPAVLALWLLSEPGRSARRRIGLDSHHPVRDLAAGAGLAALIGLPGIAFYVLGHALGITATVVPSALSPHWWTVPVLLLQAVKNAVVEEVIVVGYLVTRLRGLGLRTPAVFALSAVLRGAYHLYQGIGPFLGNVVMGLVFCEYHRRRARVMPLVVAHTLIDAVAFVGYQYFYDALAPILHLP